jgi:uncharacterized protein with GYD domain
VTPPATGPRCRFGGDVAEDKRSETRPIYITLANFTDQGIRNYKDTTKRAKASSDRWAVRSKDIYWTRGSRHRGDHAGPRRRDGNGHVREVSSLGNVRTTTLRGFGMDEIERIIEKAE